MSAMVNLALLRVLPLWSVIVMAVDVIVIYALAVHGRDVRQPLKPGPGRSPHTDHSPGLMAHPLRGAPYPRRTRAMGATSARAPGATHARGAVTHGGRRGRNRLVAGVLSAASPCLCGSLAAGLLQLFDLGELSHLGSSSPLARRCSSRPSSAAWSAGPVKITICTGSCVTPAMATPSARSAGRAPTPGPRTSVTSCPPRGADQPAAMHRLCRTRRRPASPLGGESCGAARAPVRRQTRATVAALTPGGERDVRPGEQRPA